MMADDGGQRRDNDAKRPADQGTKVEGQGFFRKRKTMVFGMALIGFSLRNYFFSFHGGYTNGLLEIDAESQFVVPQSNLTIKANTGPSASLNFTASDAITASLPHPMAKESGKAIRKPNNKTKVTRDSPPPRNQKTRRQKQSALGEDTTFEALSDLFQYPVSKQALNNASRVIVMISMGPSAHKSILVERCLMSLRTRGEYHGLVWLLTDAPPERFRLLSARDPNFISMPPLRMDDWKWHLPEDMLYKRFKTFLLDYLEVIPLPHTHRFQSIQWLYYLDIDIVAGQPIREWFLHVEELYKMPSLANTVSQMMVFEGNYAHAPLQGGQFVLQRNRSDGCLARWRYHIDQHPNQSKDQQALFRVWIEIQESNNKTANEKPSTDAEGDSGCNITIMPKEPYLKFIQRDNIHEFLRSDPPPTDFATLMHIKNTQSRRLKIHPKQLKEFFRLLLNLNAQESNWVVRSSYNVEANHTWSKEQLQNWNRLQGERVVTGNQTTAGAA